MPVKEILSFFSITSRERKKSLRTPVSLSPLKFLDFFHRWKRTGRGRKYLFSQDRNEGNSTRRLETRCIAFLFLESERRQQPVIQPARVCSYSQSFCRVHSFGSKKKERNREFLFVSTPLLLSSLFTIIWELGASVGKIPTTSLTGCCRKKRKSEERNTTSLEFLCKILRLQY